MSALTDWIDQHVGYNFDPAHSSVGVALSSIDWNPAHSEIFRDYYLPTVEALGIASATVFLPGIGGALAAGALAAGFSYGENAAGIHPQGTYAQLAPIIGAAVGAGINYFGSSAAAAAGGAAAPTTQSAITQAGNIASAARTGAGVAAIAEAATSAHGQTSAPLPLPGGSAQAGLPASSQTKGNGALWLLLGLGLLAL
jgi:hypothetical protein